MKSCSSDIWGNNKKHHEFIQLPKYLSRWLYSIYSVMKWLQFVDPDGASINCERSFWCKEQTYKANGFAIFLDVRNYHLRWVKENFC